MMKPIRVRSGAEFKRLLDDIGLEAHRAADYWCLVRGLDAAVEDHSKEFNQSPTYWSYTFRALYHVVFSHLGRLYDQTAGSLSLGNVLLTVSAYPAYFSEQSFRRRLSNNPFVENLAADMRTLDVFALEEEIRRVSSDSDELVKRLQHLRNKVVSHRDAELVRLATLSSISGFTAGEVEVLLERGVQIADKYGLLFEASWSAAEVIGADDYRSMLRLLKIGFGSVLAEDEENMRRMEEL